jgi:hypothetical protein
MQIISQKEITDNLVAESYLVKKASTLGSFSTVWTVAVAINQSNTTCYTFCIFCKVIVHGIISYNLLINHML